MALTKDVNVLMKRWMEIYMNLMILKSTNSGVQDVLDRMRENLVECNEYAMQFFDLVDADPEKAVD